MSANAAAPNSTAQKISLKQTVGGRALMMKFQVQSNASPTQMECALKYNVQTAERIWAMSSQVSTLQRKIRGTALIQCRWILFQTKKSKNHADNPFAGINYDQTGTKPTRRQNFKPQRSD